MSSEGKESSPEGDSSVSFGSSSERPHSNEVSRSSSGEIGTDSLSCTRQPLHLQVPLHPNSSSSCSTGASSASSSQQSSPRPSTTTLPDDHHNLHLSSKPSRNRGSSSSSSLSIGQISYRDLTDIQDEFKIVKILHDGKFSKILLSKQYSEADGGNSDGDNTSPSGTKSRGVGSPNKYLVLKAIPSGGIFTEDFKRELRYNYFLSPHPNIVTSFNISFNWASTFNVFVEEYAPYGDLSRHLTQKCLPENQVKLIANQLASALEFMHSFRLVHQDIRAENVLIFKPNMSRVKLCDFGSTHKEGSLLTKGNLNAHASSLSPELSYLLPQERYECHRSSDVWQVGILICRCLTGKNPWMVAEFSDPVFRQYTSWLKRKSLKVPEPFRRFTPRLVRLLKRLLEPKEHFRSEIREVFKYLQDDWIKPNCNRMSFKENAPTATAAAASGESKKNKNKRESGCQPQKQKDKLIILASNGINLLAKREKSSSGSSREDPKQENRESMERGSGQEEEEEVDEAGDRVEKWVATTTAQTQSVLREQGNCTKVSENAIEGNDIDAQKPETDYDNE